MSESRLTRLVMGWVSVFLLVCALVLASGIVASAHAGFFDIWGIGYDMWTGPVNHYDADPYCGVSCPYDYMIPLNAEVHQSVVGDFVWMYLDIPTGNVFNVADAYKGQMYLNGAHGELARSGALFCVSVTRSGGYNIEAIANTGTQGFWEQDSGGGSSCASAYQAVDKQAVTAHP